MTYRTEHCGDFNEGQIGTDAIASGWTARRRDHGGLVFIDLRDRSGMVQLVIDPEHAPAALEVAQAIRVESVIRATGKVVARAPATVNANLSTGAIEILVDTLEELAPSDPLPFQLDDEGVDEALRIRHRALDLRRDVMRETQYVRTMTTRLIRRYLEDRGFWELETPILTKSTPEGARDFVVPARLEPGSVYALPQSPQLFKQLFMMGGYERYYQIARCFRDEAQRADRQLEFTQLDLEMSFVTRDDILDLTEGTVRSGRRSSGLSCRVPSCASRTPRRCCGLVVISQTSATASRSQMSPRSSRTRASASSRVPSKWVGWFVHSRARAPQR